MVTTPMIMVMMMLFLTIMMKDLAQMVDNAGTNGISKNIDCRAESEGKYNFRNYNAKAGLQAL